MGMNDIAAPQKSRPGQGSTTRRRNRCARRYQINIRRRYHVLTPTANSSSLLAAHRHIHIPAQIPSHSLARRGPRLQGTRAGPLHLIPGQSACRIASPSRLMPIAPRNLIPPDLPTALSPLETSRAGHAAAAAASTHPSAPLWPAPIVITAQAGGMSPLKSAGDRFALLS